MGEGIFSSSSAEADESADTFDATLWERFRDEREAECSVLCESIGMFVELD